MQEGCNAQRQLCVEALRAALGASPSAPLAFAMPESESFEFSFNKEVFSDCVVAVAVSEGAAGAKRKRSWGLFGGVAPEKAEFYVTKALLARASPVFRELIEAQGQASSGKAMLRLSVASAEQFRFVEAVLRHIYTKQLSLTSGALARAPSRASSWAFCRHHAQHAQHDDSECTERRFCASTRDRAAPDPADG